jgi:hypothetical protein
MSGLSEAPARIKLQGVGHEAVFFKVPLQVRKEFLFYIICSNVYFKVIVLTSKLLTADCSIAVLQYLCCCNNSIVTYRS